MVDLINENPVDLYKTLQKMLYEARKPLPVFTASPVIVVNVEVALSGLQKEKLTQIVNNLGALKVVLTEQEQTVNQAIAGLKITNFI